MKPKYSLHSSPRFQHGKKLEPREVRRRRLNAWSIMAATLLKAQGKDISGLSQGKLALMFYRRRQADISRVTQKRFSGQARQHLIKQLESE